jgi:hypothetical protein
MFKDLTRHPIKGKHGNPHSHGHEGLQELLQAAVGEETRKAGEEVGLVEYPWFLVREYVILI